MNRLAPALLAVLALAATACGMPPAPYGQASDLPTTIPAPTASPISYGQASDLPTTIPAPTASPISYGQVSDLPTTIPAPTPTQTPAPIEVNGRIYDAYIAAATKEAQAYQYSCEFDAAWVVFATFGYDVSVDDMIQTIGVDASIEPSFEETEAGFIIHGGDITTQFSGDYTTNFLARSTGRAMRQVFTHYGLAAEPVADRAGVEAALRSGALVWMKTTVDFRPWRPAI